MSPQSSVRVIGKLLACHTVIMHVFLVAWLDVTSQRGMTFRLADPVIH